MQCNEINLESPNIRVAQWYFQFSKSPKQVQIRILHGHITTKKHHQKNLTIFPRGEIRVEKIPPRGGRGVLSCFEFLHHFFYKLNIFRHAQAKIDLFSDICSLYTWTCFVYEQSLRKFGRCVDIPGSLKSCASKNGPPAIRSLASSFLPFRQNKRRFFFVTSLDRFVLSFSSDWFIFIRLLSGRDDLATDHPESAYGTL